MLGGFTTFSSFAAETLTLGENELLGKALLNVAAQIVLGLGCAWLGYSVGRP